MWRRDSGDKVTCDTGRRGFLALCPRLNVAPRGRNNSRPSCPNQGFGGKRWETGTCGSARTPGEPGSGTAQPQIPQRGGSVSHPGVSPPARPAPAGRVCSDSISSRTGLKAEIKRPLKNSSVSGLWPPKSAVFHTKICCVPGWKGSPGPTPSTDTTTLRDGQQSLPGAGRDLV